MASKAERGVPGGLVPAGSSGELSPDSLDHEPFDPASVEVRFGNPEVDASRLFELFTDPTTIEHLQGIVLSSYTYIDPDTQGEKVMPATTVDDIRKMYEEGQQRLTLLTAESPSGLIIGTCTVEKLSPNLAEIGRVVVDKNYRGKRIVDKLLIAANAFVFREGSGGLDCKFAQAFVIVSDSVGNHVPGYHIAVNAFRRQGYEGRSDRQGATYSWSNELGRLVDRTSQPMELPRRSYKQLFPEAHIDYFPKPRPPRSA